MILSFTDKEKKECSIIIYPLDTMREEDTEGIYKSMVNQYEGLGYNISTVIYPDYESMPTVLQDKFNDTVCNKGIIANGIEIAESMLLEETMKEAVMVYIRTFNF